jgi:hypothetical protein
MCFIVRPEDMVEAINHAIERCVPVVVSQYRARELMLEWSAVDLWTSDAAERSFDDVGEIEGEHISGFVIGVAAAGAAACAAAVLIHLEWW